MSRCVPWRTNENALLIDMWQRGDKAETIAQALGRPLRTIYARVGHLREAGVQLERRAGFMEGERKLCRGCRRFLPLTEFYAHPASFSGRKSRCKECIRARARAWNQAHPEQKREAKRLREERRRQSIERRAA